MKNLLILFVIITSVTMARAQDENRALLEANAVKFFGVDFSEVRVYGAVETPAQFLYAFEAINDLFLAEPKKYDFEKLLKRRVSTVSVKAVNSVIDYIEETELKTDDASYQLDNKTIAEVVKFLPVDKEEGVGVVMIAEMFNKPAGRGSYVVVYFSIDDKEILGSFRAEVKAGGAGLRNYWANSVYDIIKSNKKSLKELLFVL